MSAKGGADEKEFPAGAAPAGKDAAAGPPPSPPPSSPPPPTDQDMPPVESLKAGDDVSGFFSPKVSAALRKRALRAVFRQGRFNLRDGLDDYDEDYTVFPPLTEATAELRKLLSDRQKAADAESVADSVDNPVDDSAAKVESKPEAAPVRDDGESREGDSDSAAAAKAAEAAEAAEVAPESAPDEKTERPS